jgi:hypothetical protein
MKKLSLKPKSVKDKISKNEPRLQTDLSIIHLLKLNFLPIIFLVYALIVILVVFLFMN